MFWKLLLSALCAALVIFFVWYAKGAALTPVRTGKHTSAAVRLVIDGAEPRLEETLYGLLWLRDNGTLRCDIIIEDAGMDDETRRVAALLAGSCGGVTLVCHEDTEKWTERQSTRK